MPRLTSLTRLTISPLPLPGLLCVQRQPRRDARGAFTRLFCAQELRAAGWSAPLAQINHSHSALRGSLRGLHYQRAPHGETKLVSCLRGAVWDLALDLRRGSPTLLRWHALVLSPGNGLALLIPPGFAHGFQALSDDAEVLYCHDAPHAPDAEAGLHPLDRRLAIDWPLPVAQLAPRDAAQRWLDADFAGVTP